MSVERTLQIVTVVACIATCLSLPFNVIQAVLAWRMWQLQASVSVGMAGTNTVLSVSPFLWVAGIMAAATVAAALLSWRAWRLYRSFQFDRRPKLTVEAHWKPEPNNLGGFSTSLERPLTLVNDSDSPAFNATVRPITLGKYTATFKCESVVRKGSNVRADVRVEGFGVLQQTDLHWMFSKETDYRGGLDPEMTVPIFMDYMDSDRKEYETEQKMTYNVFTKKSEFELVYQGQPRKKNLAQTTDRVGLEP